MNNKQNVEGLNVSHAIAKPPVSSSAWLMEIYDISFPKEPKRIACMEYPSKEAEKVKKKIDKGGTQYTYKLLF